jgi:hypothetical protein
MALGRRETNKKKKVQVFASNIPSKKPLKQFKSINYTTGIGREKW